MCGYPSKFLYLRMCCDPSHRLGSETQFITIGALVQPKAFRMGFVVEKVALCQILVVRVGVFLVCDDGSNQPARCRIFGSSHFIILSCIIYAVDKAS
jgi:hypothetical protein